MQTERRSKRSTHCATELYEWPDLGPTHTEVGVADGGKARGSGRPAQQKPSKGKTDLRAVIIARKASKRS
ncbi:hypothetical protein DPX16_19474 [Anabarilius grahami]|uniref:Uncharacterized protein n=1 Tax=Anabarilius grahami TaxID=495550 RepID=A0A3N0Z076_ANAGA|nr:hypothetical protein DPX16_19474 [Anabarilius grahami]